MSSSVKQRTNTLGVTQPRYQLSTAASRRGSRIGEAFEELMNLSAAASRRGSIENMQEMISGSRTPVITRSPTDSMQSLGTLTRKLSNGTLSDQMAAEEEQDDVSPISFKVLNEDLHREKVFTRLSSIVSHEDAVAAQKKSKIRAKMESIPGLSNDQKEFYTDAFAIFDVDGNGSIESEELRVVVKSLGIDITEKDINLMMRHVDEDGNGEVSLEEFIEFLSNTLFVSGTFDKRDSTKEAASNSVNTAEIDLKETFDSLDLDQDGYLGHADVVGMLNYFGDKAPNEVATELIWAIDTDFDGKVDYNDFRKMIYGHPFQT